MTWLYKGLPIEDEKIPPKAVGFLYMITHNESGRRYIGKKLLTKAHRRQKNLKVIKSRVESDWKDYWSSSPELLEEIQKLGCEQYTREILWFAENKSQLMYAEEKFQYVLGVVETNDYYNSNVRSKLFYRVVSKINLGELNAVLEDVKSNKGTS